MTPRETDRLVLNQAILRHKEKEGRLKKEIPVPRGEGWTVKGTIFDCNRESFQRMLSAYSDRLYVGWNPMKNEGRGCWEVWHRPNRKTTVLAYHDEQSGLKIYKAEYQPNDYEHWVADLPHLTLSFVKRLHEMDSWKNRSLLTEHDDKYEDSLDKKDKAEEENIKYIVKHHKKAFTDLLEYTQDGFHPMTFFTDKKTR